MRRIIAIALIFFMLIPLSGCSKELNDTKNTTADIVKPDVVEGTELTILLKPGDIMYMQSLPFSKYIRDFQNKFGVKVNLKTLGGRQYSLKAMQGYIDELALNLHTEEGPELIFWHDDVCIDSSLQSDPELAFAYYNKTDPVEMLIKQGAVQNMRGKLTNIDKIYPKLLTDEVYYLPFSVAYLGITINKSLLKELGLEEPELNWTRDDYYKMVDKWLEKDKRTFTYFDFIQMFNRYIDVNDVQDLKNKKVVLDTQEFINSLKLIKDEIFNSYKLDASYSYQSFYNMFFEPRSEEFKKAIEYFHSSYYDEQVLMKPHSCELLNSKYLNNMLLNKDIIVKPDRSDTTLNDTGFLINRNGKNIELAYEFINGVLDDDFQLELYKQRQGYPVNKNVEGAIRELDKLEDISSEAIKLKEYVLEQIKNGSVQLSYGNSFSAYLKFELQKEIVRLIFHDNKLTDDELSKELKRLENRYTIMLNE